jgi:hypothetical protein
MLIINPAQSWLTIARGYTKRIIGGHKSVQLGVSTSPNNAPVRDLVLLSNLSSRGLWRERDSA